jgi:hypothetical protein
MAVFIARVSGVSKVDWMLLLDQMDRWDFVIFSRHAMDRPVKQSVISICLYILRCI